MILLSGSHSNLVGQEVLAKRLQKLKRNSRAFIFSIPPHLANKKYPTKEDQATFEEKLTFILSKYWYLEERYEIMPEAEAYQFAKQHKTEVLLTEFKSKYSISQSGVSNKVDKKIGLDDFGAKRKKTFIRTAEMGRVNVLRVGKGSIEIFLPTILSKVDFVFAINQTQFFYKNAAILGSSFGYKESAQTYGKRLKSKTLLIPKDVLHEKVTLAAVKKIYPYKYEFASQEKIDRIIINKDPQYLAIYGINPIGSTAYSDMRLWLVYEPETGAIISYARQSFEYPTLPSFNPLPLLPHELKLKSFKRFLKNVK